MIREHYMERLNVNGKYGYQQNCVFKSTYSLCDQYIALKIYPLLVTEFHTQNVS